MFDDETFICGIETPKGQYTYHYNTRYWPMFSGKVLDFAPEWDGHKPDDVDRLMSLYPAEQSRQSVTDAEVQDTIYVLSEIRRNRMNVGFTIFPNWAQPIKAVEESLDLAIRILSAYRKPSADQAEIDRAIEYLTGELEGNTKYGTECMNLGWRDSAEEYRKIGMAYYLALTALRRMAGEGK
jgi:hypothetical protein